MSSLSSGPVTRALAVIIATCLAAVVGWQAMATESILRGTEVSLEEGLRIECDLFGIISSTDDMREGLNAFLEKRKPNYQGK